MKIWKEGLKGAVAGAVAVYLMDRVTTYLYKNEDTEIKNKDTDVKKQENKAQKDRDYTPDVPVEKMAKAFNLKLNEKQEDIAAKTLHYLLGIVPAAAYAVVRHKINKQNKQNKANQVEEKPDVYEEKKKFSISEKEENKPVKEEHTSVKEENTPVKEENTPIYEPRI